MRFIGITPHDSLFLKFHRVCLTISLLYIISCGAAWFTFIEGEIFGERAKALLSFLIYLYILLVYIIYLVIRPEFFDMLMALENQIDDRKLDSFPHTNYQCSY